MYVKIILIGLFGLALHGISDNQSEQLKALNHYAGAWDVQLTIQSTDGGDEQNFTGTVVGKWILNDQFLEQTGKYEIGDQTLTIRTLMSFDASKKQYRYWYFLSNGQVRESIGTWDEQTKTMTSTMRDPANDDTVAIRARFPNKGVERWVIETQHSDGTKGIIRGTNTRR